MATWINTSIGYLNEDHILLIRLGLDKEAGTDLIQLSDGRTLMVQILDPTPLPFRGVPIVHPQKTATEIPVDNQEVKPALSESGLPLQGE